MRTRLLTREDEPLAKALWKEAFGDSDSFIDWYFANKVLPGNSVGIFDGGLLSALHMIPYRICVQGRPVDSMFIAGAATTIKRRGEGLMRRLLLESLEIMRSRGITMTHLYPFSHGFYEKYGWATYTFMEKISGEGENNSGAEIIQTRDAQLLRAVYEEMMKGYDGYVVRGKREWDWRMGELFSDGGRAAVALDNGRPAAYMLYFVEEEKINVIETAFSDDSYIGSLVSYLTGRWRKKAQIWLPTETGISGAMARVVDARGLLRQFGLEDALENVRIRDGFAEWNDTGSGTELGIGELARMVHTGADGVMERMGLRFGIQKACIFEQY